MPDAALPDQETEEDETLQKWWWGRAHLHIEDEPTILAAWLQRRKEWMNLCSPLET